MNRKEAVQQAREHVPVIKTLRISIDGYEPAIYGVEIFGLDGRENEPLVLRSDDPEGCAELNADALREIIARALAAYAADRLKAELESLAKEMCPRCALRNIPNAALYHFMPIPGRDIEECSTKCKAAPIRTRLALLQEARHD